MIQLGGSNYNIFKVVIMHILHIPDIHFFLAYHKIWGNEKNVKHFNLRQSFLAIFNILGFERHRQKKKLIKMKLDHREKITGYTVLPPLHSKLAI